MAIGHGHGKYAQWFNAHYNLSGHLWGGRFISCALDDVHLWAAVRYVEQNPVRAGLVARAEEWKWSSARAHCGSCADSLLDAGGPLMSRFPEWSEWVNENLPQETCTRIRTATQTGRPSGDHGFIRKFEEKLDRLLHPQKPGPKPGTKDILTEDLFT